MVQSGFSEKAAAKRAFEHLWKHLDSTVVTLFSVETGVPRSRLKEYYKKGPKGYIIEVPATLREIFATLPEEEEGDISLSAPVTGAAQNPKQTKSEGKQGAKAQKGATSASDMCHFCKTKDHPLWKCPKTVEERRKIAQ